MLVIFSVAPLAVSTAIHDGILLWGPPVDRSIDLVHIIIATTAVIVVVSTTRQAKADGKSTELRRRERERGPNESFTLKGRRHKRQDPPWSVLYSTPPSGP